MNPPQPLRTICVTGMHRSGTSFAARALEAIGVSFGDPELLLRAAEDNEAGFWENRLIKEIDDDLLAHLGGSWDRPPVLAPGWQSDRSLEEFRVRAVEALDESFGAAGERPTPIGWKDPRLSLLLPFWASVIAIDATVVLVRHPTEVAASLAKRNAIDDVQATLLWLRYLLASIGNDPDGHLVVYHHDLFDDTEGVLRRMADHLSLPPPDAEAIAVVERDLDPRLRHHVAPASADEGPDDRTPVARMAQAVWNGGSLRPGALDELTAAAIREGWLRPPADTRAIDLERARNVDLTELLRRHTRRRMATAADEPDRPAT